MLVVVVALLRVSEAVLLEDSTRTEGGSKKVEQRGGRRGTMVKTRCNSLLCCHFLVALALPTPPTQPNPTNPTSLALACLLPSAASGYRGWLLVVERRMFLSNFRARDPLRPSFFELYAQQQLLPALKPALHYAFSVCWLATPAS
jgi:hypothetical protein